MASSGIISKTQCSITAALFILVLLLMSQVLLLHAQHESCSLHTCHPPACRCPAHSIPGNHRPEKVPQMVLIAFDDAVNWDNWHYYLRLFPPDGRRKNPNGCPISATFFVSHNFTDYCMVRKLHARGMEIGDHSVTHKLPRKWWTDANQEEIAKEVLGQKRNLAEKAQIPVEDIKGWRSPFLQPAGDDLFTVLQNNNFTYDATMTYSFPKNLYSPVLWPFTLDFGYTLVCNIARCPQTRYPGLWIIPVVVVMDHMEQKPCAYVDDCANMPRDKNEAYQMLWKNFLRNYRSNRAPLYLNLHSPWLNTQYQLDAMDEFIEKMASMDDVYLVTISQALEWQKNPSPIDQLKNFRPWQCPDFHPNVEDRKVCRFTYKHKTAPGGSGVYNEEHRTGHSRDSNRPRSTDKPKDNRSQKIFKSDKDERDKTSSLTNGGKVEEREDEQSRREKTHFGSNEPEDANSVHHHHDHRTHKPWFLKGAANVLIPRVSLLTSLVLITFHLLNE